MKTKSRWSGKRILAGLLVLVMVLSNLNGFTLVTEATDVTTETTAEKATENPVALATETWDFESAEQLDDFDLYASGTDSFSVQDGMLVPSGKNGEMKAILKGDIADIKQVSVDIIPGNSGTIDAALYLGASDAGNAAGQIDALAFLVESNLTGWTDAPNRIDIVTGTFPTWVEKQRIVSETGQKNAIYSGGTKGPINLCLDFGDGMVTVTVSLVGNAKKFVQTVYECEPEDLEGSIGIRAHNDDMCFDNFSIGYDREVPAKLQQGVEFNGNNVVTAQMSNAVATIPQTVEMWVKVDQDTTAARTALISSFTGNTVAGSQVGDWALFTNENGALWWFERTANGTVSAAKGLTIKTGEWMHVAITRETGKINYYINGSLVGTGSSETVILDTASSTVPTLGFCGYDSGGGSPNYLDGAIGDVRLWSTTRTQAQIREDMFTEAAGNEDGLMNHWGLDEQAGTVFWDSTSSKNNGSITTTVTNESDETIDGATWTEGSVLNEGLEFGAVGAKATLSKATGTIPQTVEAWVKIDKDTVASRSAIISAFTGPYTEDAQNGDWALFTDDGGKLCWYEKNENGEYSSAEGTSVKTGDWVHVAITREEGTVKYYINGVEVASNTGNIVLDTASSKIPTLGYCEYGGENVNYLDGALGDVRLWSTTRTQEQIREDMFTEATGNEDGLMNHWGLDEQAGTVFWDSTASANHGSITTTVTNDSGETIDGATWTEGSVLNEGLNFDGGHTVTAQLDKAVATIPQTVEMWVKVDKDTAAARTALIIALTGENGQRVAGDWALFTDSNGKLWWYEKDSNGNTYNKAAGSSIRTGEWMHVAITRELGDGDAKGRINYYVNGTLVAAQDSTNCDILSIPSTAAPTLGYCNYGINYLDGAIGDVRLWSTTRTQAEIKANMYKDLTGTEAGLMHNWKLDEQVGSTFSDATGSGNNGTITAGATWMPGGGVETFDGGDVTYENEGYNFSLNKVWITKNNQDISPDHTVEAWVKIPKAIKTENVIAYNNVFTRFKFSISAGGSPQLYWKNEDDTVKEIIATDVDVRTGKWTHVAFVSDEETQTVTCYVNGKAVYVAENVVLNDISTQKISIGNKYVGLMADFRYWTKSLTAEELKISMTTAYTAAVDGLALNVPFDESNPIQFRDLSGNDNTVVVYARELNWKDDTSEPGAYSMVVIPDQQVLSSRYPAALDRIYQWIADNAEEENIKFALNLGDITDYNTEEEWNLSLEALDKIDDLVPYSFIPGNHEYFIPGSYKYNGYGYRNLTEMNKYFGNIYDNSPAYGGSYDDGVENTWHEFEVNGHRYLILALEYYPRDSVLEWASEVTEAHPDHQVIVTTHSYLETDGVRKATASDGFLYEDGKEGPNTGQQMWEKFASQHENIIMVLCGHILNDNIVPRIDEGVHGNKVVQMLINGQDIDGIHQGVGFLAMLRFNEAGDEMEVTYFSPGHGKDGQDQYLNDNKFTVGLPTPSKNISKKFIGMTLDLDGTISFNFYVSKEHALSQDAYVEFDLPRSGKQTVALVDAVETRNGLRFTCEVPAKEMADDITATLYNGEEIADTRNVSIRDYAETIIANEPKLQSYAEATPLMKAMLHYGAYAQKQFAYNSGDLANKNYTSDDKVQSVTVEDVEAYKKGFQGLDGFGSLAGATLVLESETKLRMFFEFEDGVALDGLKFTVNGIEQYYKTSGNYYIVECKDIAAKDLDLEYKVTVKIGDETKFTATCSAMTFCYSAISSSATNEALKNVAKALYLYNVEANKYMEGEAVSISEYYTAKTGTVYADSNHGFSVQDGKLVPPASVGEGKVMVNKSAAESYQSMSVDIYPGEANIINGGFYLGASEANITEDSIHALTVMAESFMSDPNRVDITIGTFSPWNELARFEFKSDHEDVLFTDGIKEPLNLKVDIASSVVDNVTTYTITATLTLLSDTSKTATATYVYTGDYDLINGQIGLRSQYDDSSFDNFVVQSSKGTTTYTFDDDVTTSEYGFTYYHSTWRGGVKATADNTLALHDTESFTEGILTAEINTNGNKEAGIVFGADETLTNYYLYRLTTNNTAELVKVVDGVETVLHTEALPAEHDNTVYNSLEIVKAGNRIYCYYNGSGNIKCYAFYEDEAMLSGTGIGIWAETADTDYKNVTYKDM